MGARFAIFQGFRRMHIVFDVIFRMQFAFRDFFFQQGQGIARFRWRDDAARGVLVQDVEDTLGMFLVHQHFRGRFGFE
ncbi:hypothetical protein D3C85_1259510 [compost metagenome]